MSNDNSILTSIENGALTVTLNRPDKLNSFNDEMSAAFLAAFIRAEEKDVRSVLLTGAGRAFCAGQDLGDRDPRKMDGPPDLGNTIEKNYNPVLRRMRALDKPIVCAVNGVAAGAGANLAIACDIVLAARSAKFIQAFSKIGLVPDSGGTWSLTRLVGEARAKGLALTAQPITAETAEQWGLIWRAVDDDSLMAEANALISDLAAGPTVGLGMIKQAIHSASTQSLDSQLDLERDLQRAAGKTADYAEGVTAFLEKRAPEFQGK